MFKFMIKGFYSMDTGNDINQWITKYYDWLKNRTKIETIGEWMEISTPFLDRHNDGIVLYLKIEPSGNIRLTDDGYTLDDFVMAGYRFTTTRKRYLEKYLMSFGVDLKGNELTIIANEQNYPQKKHSLIQCILAVNDMFEFSRANVASAYIEDIAAYLDENDVRYTPNIQMQGRSGLVHNIDFVIAKSKKAPERILTAMSSPSIQRAKLLTFALNDIREARDVGSKPYVIINDNKRVSDGIISTFDAYEIGHIDWSQRKSIEHVNMLTA